MVARRAWTVCIYHLLCRFLFGEFLVEYMLMTDNQACSNRVYMFYMEHGFESVIYFVKYCGRGQKRTLWKTSDPILQAFNA